MDVGRVDRSGKYAFLQYVEVTHPRDMVDETLGCACLRLNTDDEVDHNLEYDTTASKKRGYMATKWLGMERLKIFKGCMNVVRGNHVIESFLARIA